MSNKKQSKQIVKSNTKADGRLYGIAARYLQAKDDVSRSTVYSELQAGEIAASRAFITASIGENALLEIISKPQKIEALKQDIQKAIQQKREYEKALSEISEKKKQRMEMFYNIKNGMAYNSSSLTKEVSEGAKDLLLSMIEDGKSFIRESGVVKVVRSSDDEFDCKDVTEVNSEQYEDGLKRESFGLQYGIVASALLKSVTEMERAEREQTQKAIESEMEYIEKDQKLHIDAINKKTTEIAHLKQELSKLETDIPAIQALDAITRALNPSATDMANQMIVEGQGQNIDEDERSDSDPAGSRDVFDSNIQIFNENIPVGAIKIKSS